MIIFSTVTITVRLLSQLSQISVDRGVTVRSSEDDVQKKKTKRTWWCCVLNGRYTRCHLECNSFSGAFKGLLLISLVEAERTAREGFCASRTKPEYGRRTVIELYTEWAR